MTHLRHGKNDEQIEEETSLGFQIPHRHHLRIIIIVVIILSVGRRRFGHLEMKPHVPHVQQIGHAPESCNGYSEPTVDKQTHIRVAY